MSVVEVQLLEIRLDDTTETPVLLLQEVGGSRVLPIYIGRPEAAAIIQHMQVPPPGRPQTHDLFAEALRAVGVALESVVITELRGTTFFADLHLGAAGRHVVVSARPSDAINLAIRFGCAVWCVDAVFADNSTTIEDQHGSDGLLDPFAETVELGPPAESLGHPSGERPVHADATPDEVVAEFQSFLDTLSPDDFG